MAKFKGQVTLSEFKKAAVQLEVLGERQDSEWRLALSQAKSWKRAAHCLPATHPMLAIASREEI